MVDAGQLETGKWLTTHDDPSRGVLEGIDRLTDVHSLDPATVEVVIHATTLAANTVIERTGALTGLITTAGFRDVLQMGTGTRYDLYDLGIELPEPLVPRHLRCEVEERINASGGVEIPLNESQVRGAAATLEAAGVTSVAVVDVVDGRLCTMVDPDEDEKLRALRSYGFVEELALEGFRISFDAALARVRKASVPEGFSIHPAHTADVDRLLQLDNLVRQDVPGSDGWQGCREAFVDDLSDPASYYFAVDDRSGEYAGLVRIWHNPGGPNFGLIGVAKHYRHTRIAAALIKCALEGAAEWGYTHFDTGTSLSNPVMYPRMKRLGGETTWRALQMIRR